MKQLFLVLIMLSGFLLHASDHSAVIYPTHEEETMTMLTDIYQKLGYNEDPDRMNMAEYLSSLDSVSMQELKGLLDSLQDSLVSKMNRKMPKPDESQILADLTQRFSENFTRLYTTNISPRLQILTPIKSSDEFDIDIPLTAEEAEYIDRIMSTHNVIVRLFSQQ